jgi:hypothetical protein
MRRKGNGGLTGPSGQLLATRLEPGLGPNNGGMPGSPGAGLSVPITVFDNQREPLDQWLLLRSAMPKVSQDFRPGHVCQRDRQQSLIGAISRPLISKRRCPTVRHRLYPSTIQTGLAKTNGTSVYSSKTSNARPVRLPYGTRTPRCLLIIRPYI